MATKKKAGSKSKARSRKVGRPLKQGPFVYTVNLVDGDDRIVIDGLNDGNIYGKHKQAVTFIAGNDVPPFTLTATKFVRNDSKKRKNLKKEWPFKGAEPAWPRREFEGKLWSPGLFKKSIYKYTISIDGKVAADPIIIIER
jgi:hypothetical protein